jgi:hypothetical protein
MVPKAEGGEVDTGNDTGAKEGSGFEVGLLVLSVLAVGSREGLVVVGT